MRPTIVNALALAAVAGALNALGPGQVMRNGVLGRYDGVRFVETKVEPKKRRPKPVKAADYYAPNRPREVARRRRQIAKGQLTWANGLVCMHKPGPDCMGSWLAGPPAIAVSTRAWP